jgi:hypothetical protein
VGAADRATPTFRFKLSNFSARRSSGWSNLHRVFDFFQRLVGHLLRALGAGFYDVLDLFGVVAELCPAVPDGGEFGDHGVGCEFFAIDAADFGGAAFFVDALDDGRLRIDFMKVIDWTDVRIAWICPTDARGIGHHRLELLA